MFAVPAERTGPPGMAHGGVGAWPNARWAAAGPPPDVKPPGHRVNPCARRPLTGHCPRQAQPLPAARVPGRLRPHQAACSKPPLAGARGGARACNSKCVRIFLTTLGMVPCTVNSSTRSGIGSDSTHWRTGTCADDVVYQMRRGLRHASGPARGAKTPALATEGQQLVVPTIPAAQPQEPVGQDDALQEGVELVTDELRQPGTGGLFGLGEESRSVLLHQAVQPGLLGSVARVVDRGAIAMRPPGLVRVGLHALGMRNLGWCSFSGRAGQRIHRWGDHLLPAPRRRACSSAVPCPGAPPPAMR